MKICAKIYKNLFRDYWDVFFMNTDADSFQIIKEAGYPVGWVFIHGCSLSTYKFTFYVATKTLYIIHESHNRNTTIVKTKKIKTVKELNTVISKQIGKCAMAGPQSLAWLGWVNQDITPYLPKRKDQQKEVLKYYDMLNRHPQ